MIITQIREGLAKESHADSTCARVTGIFVRIAAEAAEEDLREGRKGKKEITPYWRVLKKDGSLNPKFLGGLEAQAVHWKKEGHIVLPSQGKCPPKVKDFEKFLATI